MSQWSDGYRTALADVLRLAHNRALLVAEIAALIADLSQDALVIEHEQDNRLQRRRRRAVQEESLFPKGRR